MAEESGCAVDVAVEKADGADRAVAVRAVLLCLAAADLRPTCSS